MSYGLSDEQKTKIEAEHSFDDSGVCAVCGRSRDWVEQRWRRGMADLVECEPMKGEKGEHPCPSCGSNNWDPVLDVDGPPYDKCLVCGYEFTAKDMPQGKSTADRFREQAEKLNHTMGKLSDLTNKAVASLPMNFIPYLGWFWRNIDPSIPGLRVSWAGVADMHWWLDEAGKWDYPSRWLKGEEAIRLLKYMNRVAEASLELYSYLRESPPTPDEIKGD